MNPFRRLALTIQKNRKQRQFSKSVLSSLGTNMTEGFSDFDLDNPNTMLLTDPMLQSEWVNICVMVRARNIQRVALKLYRNDRELASGPIVSLFLQPNMSQSWATFIFETSMWYDLEGEFFWWFGDKYSSGLPKELHVINPRKVIYEKFTDTWKYNDDTGPQLVQRVLDPETFVHVWEPNPWSQNRGVPPIVALSMLLETDIAINKENLAAVRNSAIPEGVIRTDQKLSKEQAEELQERWERDHGRNKKNKKIAVLGAGGTFFPLNPELIKYSALKDVNKVAIITKYGIPLKVVNAQDQRTALSGKDSNEQYKAFWAQTLIPHLDFIALEIRVKLLMKFGLTNLIPKFDFSEIPELQEDEADLHARIREDIKVNLISVNEGRTQLHMDPIEWGDAPYSEQFGKIQPESEENPVNEPADEPAPEEIPVEQQDPKKTFNFNRRTA